ncbi:caspase domain-containing protein [Amycolatopsis sp. cmx-8-4]|uniref:caspase family protein n=1 Tax=Amycolatopsis sp. cmx-8-4 TaxID=2790947 RepID=UPI00397C01D5
MSGRPVDPGRSRILLVGTPTYRHPGLSDRPEVANNVADLVEVLTDPALGGFEPAHCVAAPAEAGIAEIGELLDDAATHATDLLLFYYSGHGLLSPRSHELYLSLAGTVHDRPAFTALRFEAVREAFLQSPARNRVMIVDSCFSGRAIAETLADDEEVVLGQLEVDGTYTLTSAPANKTAVVLPGERHTAFTGRLLSLLRAGTAEAGEMLSFGDIYRHLYRRSVAEGLPLPQQRGTATTDLLGLMRNTRRAHMAAAELPAELRAGLDSPFSRLRLAAVAELGQWLADYDPMRVLAGRPALEEVAARDSPEVADAARTLLSRLPPARVTSPASDPASASQGGSLAARAEVMLHQAEWISTRITDSAKRDEVLGNVAKTTARGDPDLAERIAAQIAHGQTRAVVLSELGRLLHSTDSDRAGRLFADAEAILRPTAGDYWAENALATVAITVASCDAGHAERLVAAINEESHKHRAMLEILENLPPGDTELFDRIALTLERTAASGDKSGTYRTLLLRLLGKAVAQRDRDRAGRLFTEVERGVMSIDWQTVVRTSKTPYRAAPADVERVAANWMGLELNQLAQAAAPTDPQRAHRVAAMIADPGNKAQALAWVAGIVADADPALAELAGAEAERVAATLPHDQSRTLYLSEVVFAIASSDPERAERIADEFGDVGWALGNAAEAVAARDPDRAERMAARIADPAVKTSALCRIAEAIAPNDPDRAEHLAATLNDEQLKGQALSKVAVAVAAGNPDRAERIAARITDPEAKSKALVGIARAWLNAIPQAPRSG